MYLWHHLTHGAREKPARLSKRILVGLSFVYTGLFLSFFCTCCPGPVVTDPHTFVLAHVAIVGVATPSRCRFIVSREVNTVASR